MERTLTDFDFAMAKCEAGLHPDLIEDYRRALSIMTPATPAFRLWENFFRSRQHILRRADTHWPAHKILLQLALEHADESPVTRKAEAWLEQGYCDWVWLRNPQRVKEVGIDPCTVLLEGERVDNIQLLPDGRVLSWGGKLRIWDVKMERFVTLKGHTSDIRGFRVLPDERILSWSADGTLRLWDGVTGACLAVLEGHTGEIKVQALPGELDSFFGFEVQIGRIQDVRVLPDGRILSWSYSQLWLWNGTNGDCLITAPQDQSITDCSILTERLAFILTTSGPFAAGLLMPNFATEVVLWQGNACVQPFRTLSDDGTLVVTLDDGHLFCLKLHRGNQRIGLNELAASLNQSGTVSPDH